MASKLANLLHGRTIHISRSLAFLVSSQVVTVLATLLLGKATALYIVPVEMGRYNLEYVTMTFFHTLLVVPTIGAFKADLIHSDHEATIRFYSRCLLLIYSVALTVVVSLSWWLNQPTLLLIGLAGVGQGLYAFGKDYLAVNARHRLYSRIQVAYSVINLLLFWILVVELDWRNATGLWWILVLLNGFFTLITFTYINEPNLQLQLTPKLLTFNFINVKFKSYKKYAFPLLSLALWGSLSNYADRYLIKIFMTDADVGQYAVGYSLGSKMVFLVAPLITYLTPIIYRLNAQGASDKVINAEMMRYAKYYILLAGCCCLVFLFARNLIGKLLLSSAYNQAYLVGPIIAFAYLFLTCTHILEIKWYANGQTNRILWNNIIGALSTLSLDLLLIPKLGVLGAALATVGGFGCQLAVCFYLFKRLSYHGFKREAV